MRLHKSQGLIAAASLALAASPSAHAATTCALTRHQEFASGPSYLTQLMVTNTTCAQGLAVVKAYYRCRVKHGGPAGRCHASVLGYTCREQRSGIRVQFDAVVTCTRGRATIRHSYVQNT